MWTGMGTAPAVPAPSASIGMERHHECALSPAYSWLRSVRDQRSHLMTNALHVTITGRINMRIYHMIYAGRVRYDRADISDDGGISCAAAG